MFHKYSLFRRSPLPLASVISWPPLPHPWQAPDVIGMPKLELSTSQSLILCLWTSYESLCWLKRSWSLLWQRIAAAAVTDTLTRSKEGRSRHVAFSSGLFLSGPPTRRSCLHQGQAACPSQELYLLSSSLKHTSVFHQPKVVPSPGKVTTKTVMFLLSSFSF